jgi:FkbM family methyltransferase
VGAADGGTSLYLRAIFPKNPIIAFEPNPRMASRIEAKATQIGNIRVRNIALGSVPRTASMYVTSNYLSSSLNPVNEQACRELPPSMRQQMAMREAIPVEVSTLDKELQGVPSVLLMKLDTQGTELDILSGGLQVLKRTRFLLVEMNNHMIYEKTCQYHELDAFLRQHSFKLVDIIVSYYPAAGVTEFDALYENRGESDSVTTLEHGPQHSSRGV